MPYRRRDVLCFNRTGVVCITLRCNPSNQPLTDDSVDGTRNEERFDTHVEQTRQNAGSRVGVERAEH